MQPDRRPVIVHITNSLVRGGTEHALLRLLHEWCGDGFQHMVVTLRAAGPLAEFLPDDVACRALGIAGNSRLAWSRLAGMLRRIRPDVIHARGAGCWSDTVLASTMLPSARVVLGFHGWDAAGSLSRSVRVAAGIARRTGAAFLAVSVGLRARLAAEIAVPADEIEVLTHGVDTRRFHPLSMDQRAQLRRSLGFAEWDVVIGTVASLTPIKRHDLLLRALAKISRDNPRVQLILLGEGPERANLEALAQQLGIQARVRFLGYRSDVENVLPALDVYACTSDSEGRSNALLEGLATGLPVVSTDVGDHAAVLDGDSAGLIVPTGDTAALAAALRRLTDDQPLRQSMSANARRIALEQDVGPAAAAHTAFYRRLVPNSWHASAGR